MKEILGHHEVKSALRRTSSSFVLFGPPGVGKSLLVREWASELTSGYERVTDLSVGLAREIADASVRSSGSVWVLDLGPTPASAWGPLLKPLEEGLLTLAISITQPLPSPMMSRLQILRCGYLSEPHVAQILAREYPRSTPRPVVARLANGSLDDVPRLTSAAKTFETLEKNLSNGRVPDLKRDPESLFNIVMSLCSTRLGGHGLPFSSEVLDRVSKPLALAFLTSVRQPQDKYEARNLLSLFFSQVV